MPASNARSSMRTCPLWSTMCAETFWTTPGADASTNSASSSAIACFADLASAICAPNRRPWAPQTSSKSNIRSVVSIPGALTNPRAMAGRNRTPTCRSPAWNMNFRTRVIVPTTWGPPRGEYTISTHPSGNTGYSGSASPDSIDQKHSTNGRSRSGAACSVYWVLIYTS